MINSTLSVESQKLVKWIDKCMLPYPIFVVMIDKLHLLYKLCECRITDNK